MATNQVRRPRFYEGQYLGAADLTTAIEYARLEDARHILGGHTWGIAAGLELKEQPLPAGGGQVDVFIQPGYAWDGFGRPIVVLSPFKIPIERLASFPFDSSNPNGFAVPVWLRYDESTTAGAAFGFEVCDTADQNSRIEESFQIEVGPRLAHADRHDPISVGGRSMDAQQVLKTFDAAAPEVFDESVSYQAFPEQGERSRWLIPLGNVHWKPNAVANQPGSLSALTAAEVQISLAARRYAGIVAESIESAGGQFAGGQMVSGHIRLHDRNKDYSRVQSNDLVWVEGPLRVEGDAKLFNGKLDFRDLQGLDKGIPLLLRRVDSIGGGGSLQGVIGNTNLGNNTFQIGPIDAQGALTTAFVVRDDGKVGVGTTAPIGRLTIDGIAQPGQGKLSFFTPTGDIEYDGGADATFLFKDTGGITAFMGGKIGMGTLTPTGRLTLEGTVQPQQGKLTFFSATADVQYDGGNDGLFVFRDTGGKTAFLGGKIGIGTDAPGFALDVADRMRVRQGASGTAGIWFFQTNTNADQAFVGMASDNQVGFFGNGGAGWGFVMNATNGNVGVGTTAPTMKLDVQGDFGRSNGPATVSLFGSRIGDRGDGVLSLRSGGGVVSFDGADNVGIGTNTPAVKLHVIGDLTVEGTARSSTSFLWTFTSDVRLKQNIEPLAGALERLLRLRGVSFEWNESMQMKVRKGTQMGLVAQDVEPVFPEWVTTGPQGYKEISLQGFEALVIESLRDLKNLIDGVDARVSETGKPKATRKKE
jgi:hypothetical protein